MTGIPIRGQSPHTAADAYTKAIARGAQPTAANRTFFDALYRDAETAGTDADVHVAQWDLETGSGTSDEWRENLNPGGVGVFPDGTTAGYRFTPETAARELVTHMLVYAGIPLPAGWAKSKRWDVVVGKGWAGTVTTTADLGNGKWATDPDYARKLVERYTAYWGTPPLQETPPMAEITFGRVLHPGYVDMTHIARNKTEGVGWDNLGKRNPKFIAIHRMWGTLKGTDAYFAPANSPHLTDYAIGCEATDGKALAGEIHKYNDPTGYRSGWASGRVSNPYGDGKAIVDKYGINAVNRDGISIEMSGYDTTPIDAFTWGEYVALCAYWIDQMRIPYTSLPINPHTGISAFIWHEEFTRGTGKKCPFTYLKQQTKRLIADVKAYLEPYQTGQVGQPQPQPQEPPVEVPQYAPPLPIVELAAHADDDPDVISAVVTREADAFIYIGDIVEAIQDTPRLQTASEGAKRTGPDIKAGERFRVDWLVKAADGRWYYVSPYWTRIQVDHTKRVLDTQEEAA